MADEAKEADSGAKKVPEAKVAKAVKCRHAKCKRAIRAKGYCRIHYKKWRRGELTKARYTRCHKEGCKKPMGVGGICADHRAGADAAAKPAAAPAAAEGGN